MSQRLRASLLSAAYLLTNITTTVALCQGTVWFRNRIVQQFQPVDVPFFDDQGPALEGPTYLAQLYFWKAVEGFGPAAGEPVAFSTNGYFYGESVLLPFVPECDSAWVQVRAWASRGGKTFEQAALAGAWTGLSSVLFLPLLGSPSRPEACLPPTLFGLEYPGSPLLIRQPQSQTVLVGAEAPITVLASSGVRMTYQWYEQPSDRPDGLILGATNATYRSQALTDNTTFWVNVTNSAGSVLSDKVTVTVVDAAPRLSLWQGAGLPVLTLAGSAGLTYRIEYNTNLGTTDWTRLVDLSLHSSPFTLIDSGATSSPARFYRAVAP